MTNQGIVHSKLSNTNINFHFFIGLNPFIVIYTQRHPYVIKWKMNHFDKRFLYDVFIVNLNNVTYTCTFTVI